MVRQEAFDVPDVDRLIQQAPAAVGLAGVGADPAADGGKDVLLPHQVQGLLVTACPGEGDVALGIDAQGAVGLA